MAKKQKPITSTELEAYRGLTLHEIETRTEELRNQPASTRNQQAYRIARQALSDRQHEIKQLVMEFEKTNNSHLLFYDSTAGFAKMAGNSVLFFSNNIASRLHWRYTIKTDTDHYFVSEDGIISFRSFDHLVELLAGIHILPDTELDRPNLHFFKLSKVYTEEQIADLRDNLEQESARISALVLPSSPVPMLFDAISNISYMIFYRFKHLSDSFAREAVGLEIVQKSHQLFNAYLAFANAKKPRDLPHLVRIVELCRDLRHSMAYINRLGILHHRDVYKILDQLVVAERIATQHYRKLQKLQAKDGRSL